MLALTLEPIMADLALLTVPKNADAGIESQNLQGLVQKDWKPGVISQRKLWSQACAIS